MINCIEVKTELAEFIKNKHKVRTEDAFQWLNTHNKKLGTSPDSLIRNNQSQKVLEFVKNNPLQ